LVGVVGRDVYGETPPGIEVALDDGGDFGGRSERRLLEQAVKENLAPVGGILETKLHARHALEGEAGFLVAVVNGGNQEDV